ncbi:hypothetical protein ILYODFUR_003602 [Ilyodon furcidens]|uniref:Uncharacterized protein n=1 Tax=Ilyodon furcidens TaxID=33524 RepID=A0ABV0SXK8_9TELE
MTCWVSSPLSSAPTTIISCVSPTALPFTLHGPNSLPVPISRISRVSKATRAASSPYSCSQQPYLSFCSFLNTQLSQSSE